MKNLKIIALALLITMGFGAAKAAAANTDNELLTINHAVNTYVNALLHGQVSDLSTVIDQNAKFTMLRGKKMLSFSKAEIIGSIKENENLEQQCTTNTSTTESNSDLTVIKVDMKYAAFIRSDYITLTNTADGWKIIAVHSVFK